MSRFTQKHLLTLLLSLFYIGFLAAQSVNSTLLSDFNVCGTTDFEITVTAGNSDLTNVELDVDFSTLSGATCGIKVENVTVIEFLEPADPLNPIFVLPDLASGESITFLMTILAPCSVLNCVDDGELFQNCYNLTANDVSIFNNCSDFYPIETANLIITELSPVLQGNLVKGDIATRTIKVVNTRFGPLETFVFCDRHQGGFCLTTNYGQVIEEDEINFCIELNAADFMQIGDGDGLFEEGEMLIIEEEIEVKSCGFDPSSSLSDISVMWGCEGQFCQSDEQVAALYFDPTIEAANLTFEPFSTIAECFCGPDPFEQGITITNNGDAPALDFNLLLRHGTLAAGGIDLESIVADSAGVELDLFPFPNGSSVTSPEPCEVPTEVFPRAIVPLSPILPGQSITVFFDDYVCRRDCENEGMLWFYGYNYAEPCGNTFFVADSIEVRELGDNVQTSFTLAPQFQMLEDSVNHTFNYELEYADLDSVSGTLTIEIEVPCGLVWDEENDAILCGQMPEIMMETLPEALLVTLEYDLPMCDDSLTMELDMLFYCDEICDESLTCMDSIQTSCIGLDSCSVSVDPSINVPITTTVNHCEPFPNKCAPQHCGDFSFGHGCEPDSICIEIIPGYVSYDFDMYRTTLGACDPDNNGMSCEGTCDTSLWRLDRAIKGDTLHAELKGRVIIDEMGSTFSQGLVDIFVTGGNVSALNGGFYDPDGVQPLAANIQIYDSSADVWYACEDIPLVNIDTIPLRYQYGFSPQLLAAEGCNIPADLVFEDGDSICFSTDYRIGKNVIREQDPTPLSLRVNFRPSMFVYNDPEANPDLLFQCGCGGESFFITGYEYSVFPGVFAVPPCDTSEFIGGSLFQFVLEEGNFFPYEFRNLAGLVNLKLEIPDGFELTEAQLTFLRYQNGTDILTDLPMTPTFNNDQICFQTAAYINPDCGLDEGFLGLFQYRFLQECDLTGSNELTVSAHLDLHENFMEEQDTLIISETANALRSLVPNLILNTTFCDITSFDDNAVFDFSITNFQTQIAAQMSGAAQNFWVYPDTESDFIDSCILMNVETGQTFPSINGIFQLDSLDGAETIDLQLICKNKSCETEEINLRFGWSCEPFTNPINLPCGENSKIFTVSSPPGQLEMQIESPTDCSLLCDTIPYHTIEIMNTELGCVFNGSITAQAPAGVTFLPGSTQVEYPCGSGNFVDTADPIILANGDFQWSLCEVLPQLTGCCLPPVIQAPNNCFKLRFLSQTSCDFAVNSRFIIRTNGEQNCGLPTNSPSDPGEELCIENVDAPYTASITVENEEAICNDTVFHTVAINVTGETQFGDCLIIEPTSGIAYVEGSCSTLSSPMGTCAVITDAQKITIPLPVGVPANGIIVLQFATSGYANLDCEAVDLVIQSATQTLANCALIGGDCSTKVITGSTFSTIQIERPILELSDFQIVANSMGGNDLVNFEIDIENSGTTAPPPTNIEIYKDTDGNGMGDELVHTEIITQNIDENQIITISGSFEIEENMLCQLIAEISPVCACDLNATAVETPISYLTGQNDTICSAEIISLGIAQKAGFTYQWIAPNDEDCIDYLENPNASISNFSFENTENTPKTCQFILLETDNMGCLIENEISVTVQPIPKICFADTEICAGEMANICACSGADFQWSPAAPNTLCIDVFPMQTTTYAVTITDAQGCTGIDEVTINVNNAPISELPENTTFCPDDTPQLDAGFNENYNYLWNPTFPTIDNPTINNPTILVTENNTFSVTITDNNDCETVDSTAVIFGEFPNLTITPDVTICASDATTITVTGAANYNWSPPLDPTACQNPECSVITISPTETTIYEVVGGNPEGCTSNLSVTVTVVDDFIMENEETEICGGESIQIHGNLETEAGMYCDTIQLPSGCDSINCVNLTVNPVIIEILEMSACEGDSVEVNGAFYTENTTINLTTQFGCDSIINLEITSLPLPDFTINGNTSIPLGDTIFLSAPDNFNTYEWTSSNGDIDCNSANCSDIPNEETTYTLTVTDQNGCQRSQSITVEIITACNPQEVEIPNAFTPNGDEFNSHFGPVLDGQQTVRVISIEIWNRWGDRVYFASGNVSWDGIQNGEPAPADVYIYNIKLGCSASADEAVLVGDVTLIR